MPRKTYADRFDALLAKDYITSNDRTFIESLYDYYKRKRALTVGRRKILVNLEERYAEVPTPVKGYEYLAELQKNVERAPADEWTRRFVSSIVEQVRAGRDLTVGQSIHLKKVQEAWTPEIVDKLISEREVWASSWDDEKKRRYAIMVDYYEKTGYYTASVREYRRNPDVIPSQKDYQRITENKYAAKILAGVEDAPLYAPGSMVSFRSTCKGYLRHKFGPAKMAMVIKAGVRTPDSACKGNKIYLLLAVGNSETFEVEERDIKKARV